MRKKNHKKKMKKKKYILREGKLGWLRKYIFVKRSNIENTIQYIYIYIGTPVWVYVYFFNLKILAWIEGLMHNTHTHTDRNLFAFGSDLEVYILQIRGGCLLLLLLFWCLIVWVLLIFMAFYSKCISGVWLAGWTSVGIIN